MQRLAFPVLLLCLTAFPASAGLIVGNLTIGSSGASEVSVSTDRLATAFLTPDTIPSDSAALERIVLELFPDPGPQTATISLWTDSAGLPGAPIGGIDFGDELVTVSGLFDFTPSGQLLLAPSTTYWVVLEKVSVNVGDVYWPYTFPVVDPGSLPGAAIVADARSSDSGANWGLANGPYVFAVYGTTAVPEPSPVPAPPTLALIGLALAGFGWLRRRKS